MHIVFVIGNIQEMIVRRVVVYALTFGLAAVACSHEAPADLEPLARRREALSPAPPARGVVPLTRPGLPPPSADPVDSVGLFVGVRKFLPGSKIADVPYAVDDAVDLAYLLALPKDKRRQLLFPRRVRLALSGEPEKPESQARLAELVANGARVGGASRSEIESWLAEPGTGASALLWVSFATHGRSVGDDEYLLTAHSRLDKLAATAIPTQLVLDRIARRPAALRLVVLDACRELLPVRSSSATQLRTLPALDLTVNAESNGPLAVLRARVGGPLFDDERRRQGVLAGALLDGLVCRAATDDQGRVTVASLATYVNHQVAVWMREHLGLTIDENMGVESHLGGTAAEQALVPCHECPRSEQPNHLTAGGERLEVFAADGRLLWTQTTSGRIAQAEIADLDSDGSGEVVLGVTSGGEDTGWVLGFNCQGKSLWKFDTYSPSPYGPYSGRMAVRKLAIADLFRDRSRQVITLSIDSQAWVPSRLTILDLEGNLLGSYWHPGHLEHVEVGSASATAPEQIVVGGINNDLRGVFQGNDYVDAIFLLDPRTVSGQAPPGGQPGSQVWYRAIVPQDPKILPPDLLRLNGIQILDADHDGNQEISVSLTEGHSINFDFHGCPISEGQGDRARGKIAVVAIGDDPSPCRRP